jgi:hypothetical protein
MHRFGLAVMLSTAWVGFACSKEQQQQPTTTSPASEPVRAAARLPPIVLPAAIPVEVAGVLVVRAPESLYAILAPFELLGTADAADVKAMQAELDEVLRSRMGMTLTSADRVTAFFTPVEGIAVVLQGVEGSPRGKPAGEVAGVALHEVDRVTLAMHDGELVMGERAAVELAIAAATGGHAALRDSDRPLVDALVRKSEGVMLAAAVDVAELPDDLRKEARALGVEQAMLSYGDEGIRAAVYGPPERLARLREDVVRKLDEATAKTELLHEEALRGKEVWAAIPAILVYYQWKQAHDALVPTLEGRRLDLHVPVRIDDPTVLTAFAGVAAAIAIPSFTKYMRRSKTAEARVGVAKLFDGVAAFFSEERLRTGEVKLVRGESKAVHRCPSDGRLVGEAGPTPPLSLRCAEGPGGRCVPVEGTPDGPGEYSMDLWLKDPVWREIGFVQEQPHSFHYGFRWANDPSGQGTCMFTAQAFGDLDDDGLFSTFERAGAGDRHGINAAAGLYIDQEVE